MWCFSWGGLLAWAKLSSILEPINHTRRIIGFDTFEGFPAIGDLDKGEDNSKHIKEGGLCGDSIDNIMDAVSVYDLNRPLNHIPKIELIKGDILTTAREYLEKNPYLIVSLLHLDIDLYEPTKVALELFVPRMPKGAIIVFDELNCKAYPGETIAVKDVLKIRDLEIQRFQHEPFVSYCIV